MKKRALLIGGPYDSALHPDSVGIELDMSEPLPKKLSYTIKDKELVYNYNQFINDNMTAGNGGVEPNVIFYVMDGMNVADVLFRGFINYGKYERLHARLFGLISNNHPYGNNSRQELFNKELDKFLAGDRDEKGT